MKALLSALIVLTMVSPLCADTVLVSEDFNGTVGDKVTTLPGWTGGDKVKISSTTIDAGSSADFLGGTVGWDASNKVAKSLTHTPGVGEIYTFTATLCAPDTTGAYAQTGLQKSTDAEGYRAVALLGYGSLHMEVRGVGFAKSVDAKSAFGGTQPLTAVDVKFVLSDAKTETYVRKHGDPSWISVAPSGGWGGGVALAGYDEVLVVGHGGSAGNVDTILLATNGAERKGEVSGHKVEVSGHAERVIYHSPETPGYTAWVGLWQLPDERLRCDFHQVTGPKEKPVSTTPVLESRDGGGTWTRVNSDAPLEAAVSSGGGVFQTRKDSCRGMAVLRDGTLVRPVWSTVSDEKDSVYVIRSTDGGKTWGEKIFFLPFEEYRAWPTLIRPLRDGRLVLFAGCWKRGDTQNGSGPTQNMTKMMFVSSDKGKTWSQPIVVMPLSVGACEESDFCELPGGDLFWVHRVEHFPDHATDRAASPLVAKMGPNPPASYWYSDRMQSIVHKKGETFMPGECESAPFPHSGYPVVLYTGEGLILHLATDGVYWTADLGKMWTRLDIPGTPYYPKALQLKDGTIVVVGHVGSDDVYGTFDQSIKQQTFRLKVQNGKP